MTRVVLHIGAHRTGSTTIQRFLNANRSRLVDAGAVYPTRGFTPENANRGHRLLVEAVQAPTEPDPWDAVIDEIHQSGHEVGILSAEEFCRMTTGVDRVVDRLAAFDLTVVFYVRNPAAFLRSAWKQQVKLGLYREPLGVFIRERFERADFGAMADRWAAAVGRDRLDVRAFEEAEATTGIALDFIDAAELDSTLAWRLPRAHVNVSPDDETTAVLRQLGRLEQRLPSQSQRLQSWRRWARTREGASASAVRLAGRLVDRDDHWSRDVRWLAQTLGEAHTRFLDDYIDADVRHHLEIDPGARPPSRSS